MKHQSHITMFPQFLLILVTIFLIHHSTIWIAAQEVEVENEFDYIEGSEKGPSHWGDLKKEWEKCKKGIMQSPIDLSSPKISVSQKLGDLNNCYDLQNATIMNRGHDISLKWNGDAGSIHINGNQYFLQQCHWHSPSEHTINGRKFDLEMHMVHKTSEINGESKIAVIGLLFKIGQPDPLLSKLSNYIKKLVDQKGKEEKVGLIDPSEIKLGKKYYRYMGSLTVPPCNENVTWTIMKKVKKVSKEQVELLREAVHDNAENNARPVQPLNQRWIQLYNPIGEE